MTKISENSPVEEWLCYPISVQLRPHLSILKKVYKRQYFWVVSGKKNSCYCNFQNPPFPFRGWLSVKLGWAPSVIFWISWLNFCKVLNISLINWHVSINQFILQSQLGKENTIQTPSRRNTGCGWGYQHDCVRLIWVKKPEMKGVPSRGKIPADLVVQNTVLINIAMTHTQCCTSLHVIRTATQGGNWELLN